MNFIKIGVLWFLIWSIIATFFAPENYQILNHLMSDLSTVKHPYPFIMDTGFYGFSVFACMSAYVLYQKKTNTTNNHLIDCNECYIDVINRSI